MRTLLFAAATTAALVTAGPASAQVYLGADPGGGGVRVGPFGFGVGPDYGPRDPYRAYGYDYGRGPYGAYGYDSRYVTPYRSKPGGYANGAGGGYWGGSSPSYDYGSYGYAYPYGR